MNDFDDNFGGPADGTFADPYFFDVQTDPYIFVGLALLAILVVAVCLAGYYLGRASARRRLEAERKASRLAIYGSVRYALNRALKSSGAIILERGREVADILEARLGLVIALNGKLGKAVATLRGAIDPKKPDTTPKPAEIKVPMATQAHYFLVWDALHELDAFWQKDTVEGLIVAAQTELVTPPPPVTQSYFKWERSKPSAAATVAGALKDADKAGTTPVPVVDPLPAKADEAPAPEPTPPPPPPAPKPSGRKLPAHKRNMLA